MIIVKLSLGTRYVVFFSVKNDGIVLMVTFKPLVSIALGRMPGDSCESIGEEEEEEEEEDSNENEATSVDDDQSPEARVCFF